ncbi:hypothetical protein, partial [Salmonella enterica]|uniref:hypothetical protein n=1 Tax=Salmonella enterica TaxID=28901 RepID=UPI003D2939E1
MMERQDTVLLAWVERHRAGGPAAMTAHLAELFRETAQVTEAEPGGAWVERALRAVPQLAQVRVASHRYVTDRMTEA